MYNFSHSKEMQFVNPLRYSVSTEVPNFNYNCLCRMVSLHKQLLLKLMTSMETEYRKGLDGTHSQKKGQGYREDKKIRGQPHSSDVNHCVLKYLTRRSLGAS